MAQENNDTNVDNIDIEKKEGSDVNNGIVNPNNIVNDAGGNQKKDIDLSKYVSKEDYEEIEKNLGEKLEEVTDYKSFFEEISPLLDKLQDMPEVAEAILGDKLTTDLANAILEGKVEIKDATTVATAHEKVKKELGNSAYNKASSEDITKLIEEKLAGIEDRFTKATDKFSKNISDIEEKREVEKDTTKFIESVGDFDDFAEDVVEYLESHPKVDDIETAYHVVKGISLSKDAAQRAETRAIEDKKSLASNAGGGMSRGKQVIKDKNILDELLPGSQNPNYIN